MLIAICDDEQNFRDELKSILGEYKANRRLNIDIFEYSNGEELLKSDYAFDMVFLDYQMPCLDGLEAARKLRAKNVTASIVFVTSFPNFVLDSFEVQPYRFFVKPISLPQIEKLMNTFIAHQKLLSPITVINESEQTVIEAKNVLYLEGAGKYCIVRTVDDTYSSSKTLSNVHSLLPQHCFYRTHKSYVVNLYSVSSFNKEYIVLTNGEIVKIGRNKVSEFNKVYKEFVKDYYIKV